MDEADLVRVQRLPLEAKVAVLEHPAAVNRVADHRVALVRQVDAQLVRAPRLRRQLHQRKLLRRRRLVPVGGKPTLLQRRIPRLLKDLQHLVQRHRRLAAVLDLAHRLLLAHEPVLADGHVDHVRQQLRHPVRDGHVGLLDAAVLELPRQPPMRLIALGHQHDAGGVAVEAVQDPRPPVAVDRAPLLAVVNQPVDERPVPPAARGVDDQVGLLVQRQEVLVLVNDVQRDRLGNQLVDRLRRRDHLDLVAALELVARLGGLAVDLHEVEVDEALDVVAGEVGDPVDEVLVDPPRQILADAKVVVLDVPLGVGRGRVLDLFDVFNLVVGSVWHDADSTRGSWQDSPESPKEPLAASHPPPPESSGRSQRPSSRVGLRPVELPPAASMSSDP